ncbi:hypothetical protein L1987_40622 [Smallanthus sonchifolius]|uniref:Uncharacterized protein n=1 Tax=Smallanthus sonchifolius TaxID=185202 RepID=A0ACB9GTL1_9ASTR|nr:hypothetical protein L1987_40622 [Smallanthus sonchifolius]
MILNGIRKHKISTTNEHVIKLVNGLPKEWRHLTRPMKATLDLETIHLSNIFGILLAQESEVFETTSVGRLLVLMSEAPKDTPVHIPSYHTIKHSQKTESEKPSSSTQFEEIGNSMDLPSSKRKYKKKSKSKLFYGISVKSKTPKNFLKELCITNHNDLLKQILGDTADKLEDFSKS